MARLYPIFLKLTGRDVLVVGAGAIAERKIEDLAAAGARVHVVAPTATTRVRELHAAGAVAWEARPFEERDADGAWLIFAATSDAEVQRRAAGAGHARSTFVIAIDDLPNGSAYSGSVVRRAPFTVALSSEGQAPALTRLLREVLERALPDEEWVLAARALRRRWRAEGTPMGSRFGELVRAFAPRASG